MEITWHGESTFTIKGKKTTVVVDPEKTMKADTALMTDDYHEKAKLEGDIKNIVNWPGEYEFGGVAVVAIPAFTNEHEEGDTDKGRILIFSILVDDVRICHLAEIGEDLDDEMLSKIGGVDILIVPAASTKSINVKAVHKAIEAIDPRIVIPMHYKDKAGLEPLLKEMSVPENEALDVFEVKGKSDLPADRTDFIVLNAI